MPPHILFCDDVCLYVYFAYRSCSAFKFEFDSKEFEKIKGFIKKEKLFYSYFECGPKTSCQPSLAYFPLTPCAA
jgi:hypothetical protein